MDRAASYPKTLRTLTINRAKLDIAAQNSTVRAARDLEKLLATQVDEQTLNLMGVAIDHVAKNPATTGQAKALMTRYDEFNKKLEATKPGMHHWGNKWLSD